MTRPGLDESIYATVTIVLLVLMGIAAFVWVYVISPPPELQAARATRAAMPTETPKPTKTPRPTSTPRPTRTPRPTDTPRPTPTPLPTNTPIPIAPSFDVMRSTVESMTEAQWKAYLDELEGQRVQHWSGWVEDVDQSGSHFYLLIDMDPPEDTFSSYDVRFEVSEDEALRFQRDQPVRFSGIIDEVSEFLGSLTVWLDDVTLE